MVSLSKCGLSGGSSSGCLSSPAVKDFQPHVFTESDWNEESITPYSLSKIKAERRAWELAGSQQRWRLITICPSMVIGPPLAANDKSQSILTFARTLRGDFWRVTAGA